MDIETGTESKTQGPKLTQERKEIWGRRIWDIVRAVSFVVMLAGIYFNLEKRVSILENHRVEDNLQKDQTINNLSKKVDLLTDKVDDVNVNVKVMRSQLDDYGPKSYVYRPYKGATKGTIREH
jgi:hypothetical protein